MENISKSWVSIILLGASFLEKFDRQTITQNKMNSRTNPVCIMVLTQEPKPEGNQLNRVNDQGSVALSEHSRRVCCEKVLQMGCGLVLFCETDPIQLTVRMRWLQHRLVLKSIWEIIVTAGCGEIKESLGMGDLVCRSLSL